MLNREGIIKWAREARLFDDDQQPLIEHLARFAALVRADEREACAKVCEEYVHPECWAAKDCAAAIRERSRP